MKKKTILTAMSLCGLLATAPIVSGAPGHGHDHGNGSEHTHKKKKGGPNGGRLITTTEPQVEFFVADDRSVELRFYDQHDKLMAPGDRTAKIVSGDRSDPVRLAFSEKDGVLVSDQALPEGKSVPVILEVKLAPDAKALREKFNVMMNNCPSCDYKEYACICGH